MRHAQPDLKVKALTPREANALQLLLDGHSVGDICDRIGITQKTLWNWRKLPAWNETVDITLKGASGDGQGQIKSMLPLATRRLKQLIHSPTENVALGACRVVLEAHATLVAREEQQQVLAALETQVEELRSLASERTLPGESEPAIEVICEPFATSAANEAKSDAA